MNIRKLLSVLNGIDIIGFSKEHCGFCLSY